MTSDEVKAAIKRLRSMKTVNRDFIVDVCRAFLGDCEVTGDELHYTLIELLEQADPDAYMPLPLDVNGVPIHVGDRLCGCWHDDEAYCQAIVNTSVIAVGKQFSRFKEWEYWNVEGIRHYEEPTVESVLAEFSEHVLRSGYHEAIDAIPEYAKKLREVMGDERHC